MSPTAVHPAVIADAAAEKSNICIDCGMCCDGTLFSEVSVRPYDDAAILITKGLTIRPHGEERVFDLPCTEFTAGRCGIYDCRPEVCRSYRCQLLRRVERGEITAADAQTLINEAKVLRDRVRTGFQGVVSSADLMPVSELGRQLRDLIEADVDSGHPGDGHAVLSLDVDALGLLLASHFHVDDMA